MLSPGRPKKRLGQHFLADRGAVRRIVDALAPGAAEPLLEIGPGRGALTGALIERAGRMAAVELDAELAADLAQRFNPSQLLLYAQDVLKLDLGRVRADLNRPGRLALAGNLPYNVSKPVAMKLVRERRQVDRAVLMFQREVARRLTAGPGSKDYGPLSVLAGEAYTITRVFDLAPGSFRPPPKVVSTVTLWTARPGAALDDADERRLRACLAVCFRRRRRTLLGNLREFTHDRGAAEAMLAAAVIDGALRAEQVEPAGFRRLAALF